MDVACFSSICIAFVIYIGVMKDVCCLRDVRLTVRPPAVRHGEDAILECHYDLEEAPLYSVKWYRGRHEFYRYSPQESPPKKIFSLPGVQIEMNKSNASQVALGKVDFTLSGNLSCEVTTDAPSFSTMMAVKEMVVVELPEKGPALETEKLKYEVGQVLRANCSSPPSKPPATLNFLLNNIPVNAAKTEILKKDKSLQSSTIKLELALKQSHFDKQGHLDLKCIALVAPLYRESMLIQLGVKDSDPVPERVRSWSSESARSFPASITNLLSVISVLVFISR